MRVLRLESEGRGRDYSRARGLVESSLRLLYRRDWPARLWAAFPRACRVDVVRHEVDLLPRGCKPVRVGFVSDLHIGPTTPVALLEAAFDSLAAESLDLLLLGGDYVFLDATLEKAALLGSLVRRVPAARKVAVLGNHDLWTSHGLLEDALRGAGVDVLQNESVQIELGEHALTIVGLDDPWVGAIDAERAVERAGDATATVVLCHSPDGLPFAEQALRRRHGRDAGSRTRVLYVCGHTHGGHVAAPWGPVIVPGRMGKRYPHGRHHLDSEPAIDLYVSRGVGGIEVPIRTYAPPEVACFELVGARLEAVREEPTATRSPTTA